MVAKLAFLMPLSEKVNIFLISLLVKMPNNYILARFYVPSEIYMPFSRPEDLATLLLTERLTCSHTYTTTRQMTAWGTANPM